MKLYFATWIYEPGQQEALSKKGAQQRLMSYYHLSDNEKKGKLELKGYLENETILCGQLGSMAHQDLD